MLKLQRLYTNPSFPEKYINNQKVVAYYSIIDEKLTFRDHMHDKINKAYAMLGIIKRNFNYLCLIIQKYGKVSLGLL